MSTELVDYIAHREEVLGRVRRVLRENLGVRREPQEIDPDTPLFGTGLGLDSVDAVELLVSLEAEFGVRLPNDITGRAVLRTVNSVVDLVIKWPELSDEQ
jgi:acyl carrier protein